ncbi:hypothetical protein M434DRAFT_31263 [Hypoxylon sp. CO27-5]|nr:hypothetical protein M434DRAFT_31263 [Hypoxylon sp. CO27-5]
MSTSKALKLIFDSLKSRSIKEQRDPPPRYDAIMLSNLDDRWHRARCLVEQHSDDIPWFFYPDASIVKEYLEAFACGESLGAKNEQYVYAALDEFRKGINADTELSRLRQRLTKDVVNSWCYITPRPHLPFWYLAACIHETSINETHREDLLYMIDLLDKQFLLLRVRHNCLYAEDIVMWKPSEVYGFVRFASLIAEAQRGNHDFRDLVRDRELIKTCFGKSEVFLDDLFCPAVSASSDSQC